MRCTGAKKDGRECNIFYFVLPFLCTISNYFIFVRLFETVSVPIVLIAL